MNTTFSQQIQAIQNALVVFDGPILEGDYTHTREALNDAASSLAALNLNPDIFQRVKELEDQAWKLIQAMDQYSFFLEGYRNGSASISEATVAGEEVGKVKSELWDLLKNKKP